MREYSSLYASSMPHYVDMIWEYGIVEAFLFCDWNKFFILGSYRVIQKIVYFCFPKWASSKQFMAIFSKNTDFPQKKSFKHENILHQIYERFYLLLA